jgi:hypothetical protein
LLDWIYAPSKGVYLQNTQGNKFTILVTKVNGHILVVQQQLYKKKNYTTARILSSAY